MAQLLTPDICVIGAGAGGLAAAMQAAASGASVVLIERERMGGKKLNTGCVPSKAFLAAAARCHAIRTASKFGIKAAEPEIDYKALTRHIQSVVDGLAPNDSGARLNGLGVDILREEARFTSETTLMAGSSEIKAKAYIVATGAVPFVPSIPGLNRIPYFTEESILRQPQRFPHLLVLGGTPTGIELAQGFRRLGSEVTVLESGVSLARDDNELRQFTLGALRQEGLRILENAVVARIETFGSGLQVIFSMQGKSYSLDVSHLLVAAGWVPQVSSLDVDAAGIEAGDKGIVVNANLQTSNARVYAVGDVTGVFGMSHAAAHLGRLAVKHALFRTRVGPALETMPWVTFTGPEIAHVGLTEESAREKFGQLSIARWPYFENDRAHAEGETGGFVKVIASRRGRILGAGIAGAQAGELIQMWSLAMQKGLTLTDMSEIVCPYPTLSEINKQAALNYLGPASQSRSKR